MPFVKVDADLLESSLWPLKPARDLFLTMLMMAKPVDLTESMQAFEIGSNEAIDFMVPPGENYGMVTASGSGIARRAIVTEQNWQGALEELAGPDPESRNPRFDGRRIARVKGGFIVLNYAEYRDKDYSTPRVQKFRDKQREFDETAFPPVSEQNGTPETQAEAKAYSSPTTEKPAKRRKHSGDPDQSWIDSLKSNPAYKTIDIDVAIGKCSAWCDANGQTMSRRRIVNWLNRERPVRAISPSASRAATSKEISDLEDEVVSKTSMNFTVFRERVASIQYRTPKISIDQLRAHFLSDDEEVL